MQDVTQYHPADGTMLSVIGLVGLICTVIVAGILMLKFVRWMAK